MFDYMFAIICPTDRLNLLNPFSTGLNSITPDETRTSNDGTLLMTDGNPNAGSNITAVLSFLSGIVGNPFIDIYPFIVTPEWIAAGFTEDVFTYLQNNSAIWERDPLPAGDGN